MRDRTGLKDRFLSEFEVPACNERVDRIAQYPVQRPTMAFRRNLASPRAVRRRELAEAGLQYSFPSHQKDETSRAARRPDSGATVSGLYIRPVRQHPGSVALNQRHLRGEAPGSRGQWEANHDAG